ncbi:hypothetical protein Tco_0087474 [Tanacetum coccineum]
MGTWLRYMLVLAWMRRCVDIEGLGLVDPEYTVSLLAVNKLIKDSKLSVCFDETKCYIQDLKREKVLGIGSESDGLYLFDFDCPKSAMYINRSLNLSNIDHNNPCEVCYKAKQTRESFPLNEHKSTCFVEPFRLPFLVLNGKSPFSLVYGREPNLSYLRSFGCLFAIVVKGSDKFSHRSEKCMLIGHANDINTFKQGSLPVSEYYHKLNSLWREFDILTKLPDCVCPTRIELVDHGKLGILPEVKDAFVIISREESHRGIPASSIKSEKPQVSAFVSRTNDNNRKRTNGNWCNNNGNNVNKGNYDSLICKNCGLKGHTIDRRFEIIGYPLGFKRNPNLKPSGNFNNNKTNFADTKDTFVGNNDVKTSAGTMSLTNEHVTKLMSLLNEKSGYLPMPI